MPKFKERKCERCDKWHKDGGPFCQRCMDKIKENKERLREGKCLK